MLYRNTGHRWQSQRCRPSTFFSTTVERKKGGGRRVALLFGVSEQAPPQTMATATAKSNVDLRREGGRFTCDRLQKAYVRSAV